MVHCVNVVWSCRVVWSKFVDYVIRFRYRGTVIAHRYGPGTGRIWLDDVHCVGNELSIANCPHAGWNVNDCDHSEDVSVSCGTSPVGLHYGNFIYRSWYFASEIWRAFSVLLSLAFSVSDSWYCMSVIICNFLSGITFQQLSPI